MTRDAADPDLAAREAARTGDGRYLGPGVWERNPRAIAFCKQEGFIDMGSKFFDVGPDRQVDRVLGAEVSPGRDVRGAVDAQADELPALPGSTGRRVGALL